MKGKTNVEVDEMKPFFVFLSDTDFYLTNKVTLSDVFQLPNA